MDKDIIQSSQNAEVAETIEKVAINEEYQHTGEEKSFSYRGGGGGGSKKFNKFKKKFKQLH
jgi:hypothetical protein